MKKRIIALTLAFVLSFLIQIASAIERDNKISNDKVRYGCSISNAINIDDTGNISTPLIHSIDSENLSDGSIIEINGLYFGEKNTGPPLVFEDFDSNDVSRQHGDEINSKKCSMFGEWRSASYNMSPTYTDDGNRIGSVLCSYHYLEGGKGVNHAPMWMDFSESNTSTILISYWTKVTYTLGTDDIWQLKYFRLTDGNDPDNHTYLQDGWWTNRPDGARAFFEFFLNPTNPVWPIYSAAKPYDDITLDYNRNIDTWNQYVCFIKQDTNEGICNIWIDGVQIANETAMQTFENGEVVKSATFAWYMGNNVGDGTAVINFDDIYIDNSWSSVWMGNAENWNDCTHREIQIPTSWIDNSITINANQGSFLTGETVYLFVVDENGNVSIGYEIVIGN